jgi:hypothetical protein
MYSSLIPSVRLPLDLAVQPEVLVAMKKKKEKHVTRLFVNGGHF